MLFFMYFRPAVIMPWQGPSCSSFVGLAHAAPIAFPEIADCAPAIPSSLIDEGFIDWGPKRPQIRTARFIDKDANQEIGIAYGALKQGAIGDCFRRFVEALPVDLVDGQLGLGERT
jgi:hypothetical protein